MAVEHYHRTFNFSQPAGQSYLVISNTNQIKSGDTLFLGPSSDFDNTGATEKVSVSHVTGNNVFLNSPTFYQYAYGDKITFFNNVYLISKLGLAGDAGTGTIFKHDAYSGTRIETSFAGEYARITGARWSTEVGAVACISTSQLLFINPYNYYFKWKSMFLSNIPSSNSNYFEVYDVVFDGITVYKLAKYATTKDDTGRKVTESWSTYNYQQDTLAPYTHNVAIYTKRQNTIGTNSNRFYVQTRDQFGVGLRDVNINFYADNADIGANFDPLNGQAITGINGKADMEYNPSGLYTGPTTISVRADKSSSFTGSQYSWNFILVDSKSNAQGQFGEGAMFQRTYISSELYAFHIFDPYKSYHLIKEGEPLEPRLPPVSIFCLTYFTAPGGHWEFEGHYTESCWPAWQKSPVPPGRTDGPPSEGSCRWGCITWPATDHETNSRQCSPGGFSPRSSFITQLVNFTQVGVHPEYYLGDWADPEGERKLDQYSKPLILPQSTWFWQYRRIGRCSSDDCLGADCCLNDGEPIPHKLFQITESVSDLQASQLHMSKHSHWTSGVYQETVNTEVPIDQFVFVQDAIPVFWSEKNPRETYIWIRLRPAAFSLDGNTLKFYVREVYTVDDVHYDTGYHDVVDLYGPPTDFNDTDDPGAGCTLNNPICFHYFDAGGGALGLEFLYLPLRIFHHNALVYVHIEIYDTSAEPNYIFTDYFFRIIPDYKSPYLENEQPGREEDQVALDTKLYFEIKDAGEGVDMDSLEVYLNSRIVYHAGMPYNPSTVIEEVSLNHYKVTIDLPYDLQYGKDYSVAVQAIDISENKNILRDSYRFYTRHSEVPWFTGFDPKLCKRGMPRFRDVSFVVLGAGDGVDDETIRIQVHDKDVTDKSTILPIIYRVS